MRGIQITVGSLLTVLFLATAVYLWSVDMWNYVPKTSPADFGMIGQMVLSVDKVDLIDASQAGLPWAGETWLINLVVNPQDAESIIARTGYLEDTIPNEELAADGKQAMYDLKIRITPVTQQCIYGPDFTTMQYRAPAKVIYKEFDLGTGLTCPHASDWQQFPEQYKQDLLQVYDDVAWVCTYYCGPGIPKHAYVVCDFLTYVSDVGRTGVGKMTLETLYVKDKISVTAGYKTAEGTTEDTIDISSENPSTVLYYGTTPVGKVNLVGYLKAADYCPEGANYYLFNNGSGWKIVPETLYNDLYSIIRPLDLGQMPVSECTTVDSWDDFDICKTKLREYADMANNYISTINSTTPTISGKTATTPATAEYSASYYFAITPDRPVAYSMYRMYLKATWVGILVSTAKPQIDSVVPATVTITGPETQQVSVTIRNVGDEGGIVVTTTCTNNFLVDGKVESARTATFQPQETKTFTFNISYGGSGTSPASGSCVITAKSSANPQIYTSKTITAQFTPKGVYPPNTTVCISSTAYARTDEYGNIVPGTERTCPENTYCEDTPSGAQCKEEAPIPTPTPTPPTPTPEPSINWIIAGVIAVAIVVTLLIALAV